MQCPRCGGDVSVFKKTNPTPIYPLAGLLIAPIEEMEVHLSLRSYEKIVLLCPSCGDVPYEEAIERAS